MDHLDSKYVDPSMPDEIPHHWLEFELVYPHMRSSRSKTRQSTLFKMDLVCNSQTPPYQHPNPHPPLHHHILFL